MVHVVLSFDQIVDNARLPDVVRQQSGALTGAFELDPRRSSVFATQQRWLMAQVAFGLYFRSPHRHIVCSDFLKLVAQHEVASRNTADAFLKEMVRYGLALPVQDVQDKRTRPVMPCDESLQQIAGWLMLHLASLDGLDGGARMQMLHARADILAHVQPLIADALLTTPSVRDPVHTFALFTWLNGGGVVMDRIMSSVAPIDPGAERIMTGITSVDALMSGLVLSRSHLMRKLREAELLGSIGWTGRTDHSTLWVSHGFWREYATAQAVKLAIIDRAFAAAAATSEV